MKHVHHVASIVVPLVLTLSAFADIARASAGGQVVVDSTFGHPGPLSGPHFVVPASVGKQEKGNLFQSLRVLNLQKGQSVTFTGPNSVNNIFARVTGGRSNIDGTLASDIPGADFYLINS